MNTSPMLTEMLEGVGIDVSFNPSLQCNFVGDDCLPSCFQVTELASCSMLSAACALAEFCSSSGSPRVEQIFVDRRLSSLWFNSSLIAIDWQQSGLWDSVAGDYACADGWIRLHTNAPHHRRAAMQAVLGDASANSNDIKQLVSVAVLQRSKDELEQAVLNAGGCAASMRSLSDWQAHAQGMAVMQEPLVHWHDSARIDPVVHAAPAHRPLAGIRVLDLTRVLAGPVSTRYLAAYGAQVLRIDPLDWDEPAVVPEVTLGKRCAHLDLKDKNDRERFLELIECADVLVHGYRPGALDKLGLSDGLLCQRNPALVNVSLCAYGWQGPWAMRRGFDSLVQMSCGLAHAGMQHYGAEKPRPLPVQALDHATGYLMAAAALHALALRQKTGQVLKAKLSLARTAHTLQQKPQRNSDVKFAPQNESDLNPELEHTTWGVAQRVNFPLRLNLGTLNPDHPKNITASWDRPASDLRTAHPKWI